MSAGFGLPYRPDKNYVRFSAGNDADMEDEGLEAPLVRERRTCQNNVFLDADIFNQNNYDLNTANWNIGQLGPDITLNSTGQKTKLGKVMYAPRIKRVTPNFIQFGYYTACVNYRNNKIEFRINSAPTVTYVATIYPYNYLNTISTGNPAILGTLANAQVALNDASLYPSAYPGKGDPHDGIINWILFALNTAVDPVTAAQYNPTTQGQWQFFMTNGYLLPDGVPAHLEPYQDASQQFTTTAKFGYFYRSLAATPGAHLPFAFIGGNIFDAGRHLLGMKPVSRDLKLTPGNTALYETYKFVGPIEKVYTRYIDICSNALTQFTKLANSGTGVQANLVVRIYLGEIGNGRQGLVLDGYQQQVINMRKDFQLTSIDLFILDEYSQPIDIPQQDANSLYISIGLLGQL